MFGSLSELDLQMNCDVILFDLSYIFTSYNFDSSSDRETNTAVMILWLVPMCNYG